MKTTLAAAWRMAGKADGGGRRDASGGEAARQRVPMRFPAALFPTVPSANLCAHRRLNLLFWASSTEDAGEGVGDEGWCLPPV